MSPLRLAIVAAGLAAALAAAQASAAPAPASAFGRLPAIQSAAVSPNGTSVALVSGTAEQRSLSIAQIDKPDPVLIDLGNVRTSYVRWAGDEYVLVNVTKYGKPSWSKYSYNFTRDLIFDRLGGLKGWLLSNSPESGLMSGLPVLMINGMDQKPWAIVQGQDITGRTLWKVDVTTGKGSIVTHDPAWDWALDRTGDERGKLGWGGSYATIWARAKGQMGWRTVVVEKDEDKYLSLLGYSDPEDAVYWWQEDGPKGTRRIRKITPADGKVTDVDTVEQAGQVDVRFDPFSGAAVAVVSTTDVTRYHWLDPKLGAVHASLSKLFKGKTVEIENWSEDRNKYIIRVFTPSTPPSWYLFDTKRKEVSALGDEYPELKDTPLGTKSFYTYKARDGLELPAYLHLPPVREAKGLPLVVLPHGGPNARDDGEFDWWAQFLASRGYAVLQPQFRGSDGFGYDLRKAGKQHWGDTMQTDLIDGVADLAAKGTIDAKRVCIVGASYGGYSALRGMTAFPDAYRCAVSVNGVADPGALVVQIDRRFAVSGSAMRETFGDNAAQLAAASPYQHAQYAKGPILLIYSAEDTTVPPEQTTMMRDRLKQLGKPVETVLLTGDDHHLMTSASRIQMLTAMETFLAKNLPAGQ